VCNISFLNNESLNDFAVFLAKMVHELEILQRFASVAVSIESLLDISTMSIEEITQRRPGRTN
jgi:uncharacterized protein YutE (UPF0331/DUF86 family)